MDFKVFENYEAEGQLNIFELMGDDANRQKESNDWKWSFKDYPEKNGLKAFSCFACGGGSTMGYKLAGVDVIGCLEIDPKMNEVYVKNHNPKHNFCMDIREFNKIPNEELPPELFNLDILDGSPPCTTFSMAGDREESWGKKKKFREGQAEQTLDDLSFVFIETVAKLKPKVVIMENVEGLLLGNAWRYVQEIYRQFDEIGYDLNHWLLKGENMGVPQTRHRVIFVATRKELGILLRDIDMHFNYEPVVFGKLNRNARKIKTGKLADLAKKATSTDMSLSDIILREEGRQSYFSEVIVWDDMVCPTLVASSNKLWIGNTGGVATEEEIAGIQTFPIDYDFHGRQAYYICGMSVPPIMIKRVVTRLIEQGIFDYKLNGGTEHGR